MTAHIAAGRARIEARADVTLGVGRRGGAADAVAWARSTVANIVGGVGSFYGASLVRAADARRFGRLAFPTGAAGGGDAAVQPPRAHNGGDGNGKGNGDGNGDDDGKGEEALAFLCPVALLTATPSRAAFPRGLLWDEGFQQLLVRVWEPSLSADVGGSWVAAMRAGGWIPCEQTLDVEARARFSAHVRHLMVQSPAVANPPTLLMLLRSTAVDAVAAAAAAAARAATGVPADRRPPPVPGGVTAAPVCVGPLPAAVTVYAVARALVGYLQTTQAGPIPGTYRWRGRSAEQAAPDGTPHTLASGLDDFPRGRTPDDRERHVDLAAWVA